MEGVSFRNLPVLVVAVNAGVRERLKACFLSSDLSSTRINSAASFTEALSQYLSGGEAYGAVVVSVDTFSTEAMTFIEAVHRNNNGPVIVVTDCQHTIRACREQGRNYIIRETGFDKEQMLSLVPAAFEAFRLGQSVKRLENICTVAEKRFQDMADHFTDWLWETDRNLNLVLSSSRKRPAREAQPGAKFTSCFLPEERSRIEDDFNELSHEPKPFYDVEYWSSDAYGTRVCWALTGVPVLNSDGEVTGFRGMARDVSKDKASVDQIYALANNDPLTGLYNRSRFQEEMKRVIRRAKRGNQECVLFVINVDRFKYVNEIHGHEIGDKLLIHVAQLIKDNTRAGDSLARIGGDEFAIILPDAQGSDVETRAQNMINAINGKPFRHGEVEMPLSASIGVARYPIHGRTADELLSRVDIALHGAKDKGRNRMEQFNEKEMSQVDVSRRLKTLDVVSKALTDGQDRLILHFQPIVPLSTNDALPRYEVLVRLISPTGEIVPAVEFIEVAEEFGLIAQIDKFVALRAIDLLEKVHHAGRRLSLSVNVSGKTFDDDAFLKLVADRLRRAALPKEAIVFEITETAVLRDLGKVKRAIAELRQVGAAFALDDCGVGYSSFNYIKQLDLDFIKIDGTFVRHLGQDNDKDEAFVRALHDVAQRMKILTVAESVENAQTAELLKKIGVDFGQGYYFGRPKADIDDKIH